MGNTNSTRPMPVSSPPPQSTSQSPVIWREPCKSLLAPVLEKQSTDQEEAWAEEWDQIPGQCTRWTSTPNLSKVLGTPDLNDLEPPDLHLLQLLREGEPWYTGDYLQECTPWRGLADGDLWTAQKNPRPPPEALPVPKQKDTTSTSEYQPREERALPSQPPVRPSLMENMFTPIKLLLVLLVLAVIFL